MKPDWEVEFDKEVEKYNPVKSGGKTEYWCDYDDEFVKKFITKLLNKKEKKGQSWRLGYQTGYEEGKKENIMGVTYKVNKDLIKELNKESNESVKMIIEEAKNEVFDKVIRVFPEEITGTKFGFDACEARGYSRCLNQVMQSIEELRNNNKKGK